MFSAFFDDLYLRLFDGSSLLYPAVHASIDVNAFTSIGTILSHAYLIAGIFPDRIAFPCLAAALLGPNTTVPESLLRDSFVSSLSAHESDVVHCALRMGICEYPSDLRHDLISILASQGCREIPNGANLKRLLVQAARHMFLIKPAAALYMLNNGIPQQHRSF